MFKVTFAFEDGSAVETYANEGDNLLEIAREANVAIDAPVPVTEPAENAVYSLETVSWTQKRHFIFQKKNSGKDGDWPV